MAAKLALIVAGKNAEADRSETSMNNSTDSCSTAPYNLSRFLQAQGEVYDEALAEIRSGQKRGHWMWYIFPQLDGLAFSSTARHYAIKSLEEVTAYLEHAVLGPRLLECAEAIIGVEGRSAREFFGSPDDLKLRSCATLFACVSPSGSVFERLLRKYYRGEDDMKTIELLGINRGIRTS